MDNRFLKEFENDEAFGKQLQAEINGILSSETQKPDSEMDMDLINDCVDALIYLNQYDESVFSLTPKIVKKFHTKLQISRLLKTTGTLVAAIVIVLVVVGVYKTSTHDAFITQVETTTNITYDSDALTTIETTTHSVSTAQIGSKLIEKESANASNSGKTHTEKTTTAGRKKPENTTEKPSSKPAESTTNSEPTTNQSEEPTEQTTKSVDTTLSVESLSGVFNKGFKNIYFVGEEFDSYGLDVIAQMSDGSTQSIDVGLCSIYGFNSSSPGTNTIVVSYGGKSFSFKITIAS